MFELCEGLLDRIEIGAVGRQEEQMRSLGADGVAGGPALVTSEVVENDDLALCQSGSPAASAAGEATRLVSNIAACKATRIAPVAATVFAITRRTTDRVNKTISPVILCWLRAVPPVASFP
jgi:hypothetical protein